MNENKVPGSLITMCDFNYIENFMNYVRSYLLYEENLEYNHFFIFKNEEDKQKIKRKIGFLSTYKNIKFHYVQYPKDYFYDIRIFSCHYRFEALKSLINDYDILIYTDVDVLINKSINLNDFKNYDIYLACRYNILNKKFTINNNKEFCKISNNEIQRTRLLRNTTLSGMIIVKKSNTNFINEVVDNYQNRYNNKNIEWETDQFILNELVRKLEYNIGFIPLSYFDFNMDSKTHIHYSKGKMFPTTRDIWINACKINKSKMKYNVDLYFDRNKNDKIIKPTLEALENKCTNVQKDWGTLINSNNKIAILWGCESKFKSNTIFRTTIKNHYENVLVIEQGFIERKDYRALTWNEQGGKATILPTNCDSKRLWNLNFDLKSSKINEDGYILVCGQIPWDRQSQFIGYEYNKWLNEIFKKIKEKTDKKIVFRYHPKYLLTKNNIKHEEISIPSFVEIDKNSNILDSIQNSYVLVTYNSTCLLDALMNGCPYICFDNMTPVYDLGRHSIDDINNLKIPTEGERLQKLYDISYYQWNLDEIVNGEAIEFCLNLIYNKD